jgi:hypothetical protein
MLGLQSIAHHAHRVLVQPVKVGLLAQPRRRTRPGSLLRQHFLHYGTFFTKVVKKSQQANGASEHLRIPLPRCEYTGEWLWATSWTGLTLFPREPKVPCK